MMEEKDPPASLLPKATVFTPKSVPVAPAYSVSEGGGGRKYGAGKGNQDQGRAARGHVVPNCGDEPRGEDGLAGALSEDGVEWLAVRVTSKQIKDGRFDLPDISVKDAEGELVALSHHVAMILSIDRNTSKSQASL